MQKMTKEGYVKELTGQSMPEENVKKDKKILCIMGTAYSRHKAPFDNPNAEFWGVGHCLLLSDILKLDKVFETHLPYIYESEISPFSKKPIVYHANKEDRLYQKMNEGNIHVVLGKENPKINDYEIMPREYLKEKYRDLLPPSDAFYATNSIAWMIVWALDLIIEKNMYDEIHLYGIHLETSTEWQYERPCNEWWLGVVAGYLLAHGKRGVIYLPEESDVLRGYHEYGFADIEIRRKKIQGKIEFFDKAIRELTGQINQVLGRMRQLEQEKAMPIEQKIEFLKNNLKLFKDELDVINSTKNLEEYKKTIDKKIDSELNKLMMDLRNLETRCSAFNGAREQKNYDLMELNA